MEQETKHAVAADNHLYGPTADEINRVPSKTRSALLECMEESPAATARGLVSGYSGPCRTPHRRGQQRAPCWNS
jgi:hypothetical protein